MSKQKSNPQFTIAACSAENPIRVFPDGNQWCALLGENLQEGVSAFANTADIAVSRLLGEIGDRTIEQWAKKPL